jgi:hypothetical protein
MCVFGIAFARQILTHIKAYQNNPMTKSERGLKFALFFFMLVLSTHGQNWNRSDAPSLVWQSLAGSLDGTNLVAASLYDTSESSPGLIYTSTNSGQNWNLTSAPSNYWFSVASSADGVRLIAAADGDPNGNTPGPIWLSTNGGLTWQTNSAPQTYWQTVASSTNGQVLVGNAYGDGIYISTNFGSSWILASNAPTSGNWLSLTISANGSKIYATDGNGIYVSTNTGVTWTNSAPVSDNWSPITCSQDGSRVFAGIRSVASGAIYVSTNSGATWGLSYNQNLSWQCLAMSANGSTVFAGAYGDSLYLSTNGGASWNPQNTSANLPGSASWYCSYCSANGGSLAAGAIGDTIYIALPVLMHIQTVANHAVISWPASTSANGFQLQTIGALNPAASWTNLTTGITVIGTTNFYTNSLTAPSAFFRLHQP